MTFEGKKKKNFYSLHLLIITVNEGLLKFVFYYYYYYCDISFFQFLSSNITSFKLYTHAPQWHLPISVSQPQLHTYLFVSLID